MRILVNRITMATILETSAIPTIDNDGVADVADCQTARRPRIIGCPRSRAWKLRVWAA
jgi:hypothetical protein